MNSHWILVADAGRARVLSTEGGTARLQVVHKLEHPSSRSRSQQLVSDEPGRIEKSGKRMMSAMDPRTDPHDNEAVKFAQTLADLLDDAANRRSYSRLTIVAPPHFLGLLKSAISSEVKKSLAASVPKDLTRLEEQALLQHLQNSRGGR